MESTSLKTDSLWLQGSAREEYSPYHFKGDQPGSKVIRSCGLDFDEVLQNMNIIESERSVCIDSIGEQQEINFEEITYPKQKVQLKETYEKSETVSSQSTVHRKMQNRKSLIYKSTADQVRSNSYLSQKTSVTVFYFNLPTNKIIPYTNQTTIEDLINYAIQAYSYDCNLDQSKISDLNIESYEMRLLIEEEGFKADMNIQPIGHSRQVSDNFFDALVLLYNPKKKNTQAPLAISLKKSLRKAQSPIKNPSKTIYLYNDEGQFVGKLSTMNYDQLSKVFDYIQSHDLHHMRSYYLSQYEEGDSILPKDFQIKNLQFDKIYIRAKKFIDDSDFDLKSKPIREISSLKKDQNNIKTPMSLQSASNYEEFIVIKINSKGVPQQRILGIDQHKIYNYDRTNRQEKRQTSFFAKIFGADEQTGTKNPFRLVNDVKDIRKTAKGVVIQFKEKAIQYIIDEQNKQKIFRKITYLLSTKTKLK